MSPYRDGEQPPFELCQQRVVLDPPEIEEDGTERRYARCSEIAVENCARCRRVLCAVHRPRDDRACAACESELEQALAAVPRPSLDRARTIKLTIGGSLLMAGAAVAFVVAFRLNLPYVLAHAIALAMYVPGTFMLWRVREDRVARYHRDQAHQKLIAGQSSASQRRQT